MLPGMASVAATDYCEHDRELYNAARDGKLAEVQRLQLAGGRVDAPNVDLKDKPQPVHAAASHGHLEVSKEIAQGCPS